MCILYVLRVLRGLLRPKLGDDASALMRRVQLGIFRGYWYDVWASRGKHTMLIDDGFDGDTVGVFFKFETGRKINKCCNVEPKHTALVYF